MCRKQNNEDQKNEEYREMCSKIKEQDKTQKHILMNEMEMCDLPDKEFKITVIKMLTEVKKQEQSEISTKKQNK